MRAIKTLMTRELRSYLYSPISCIFIVIFLLALMGFTFVLGRFYDSNNANLGIFFQFHAWIYLFLIPAIGMRLWAEEKREGTLEVLATLPYTLSQLVLGKFLAAWLFVLIGLAFTFPIIMTVAYLGSPDLGPIFTGYLGSWLMAGAFLAVTSYTSSLTQNQVISFVVATLVCLVFVLIGYGVFQSYLGFLPAGVSEFISNLGFMPHFRQFSQGVIDLRDLIYFGSIMMFFLMLNARALEKTTAS